MRTTLTLDDDVAQKLERLRRERPESFKQLVNEALREGIARMEAPKPRRPFRTRTVDLGEPLIDLESVSDALAIAEGDAHR
jgi:hypothetical protein